MGRTIDVKMAKASKDDLRMVREFFQVIEEFFEYGTHSPSEVETTYVTDEQFIRIIHKAWNGRGAGVCSSWSRVVMGCEVLIDNCCDPDSDTLEWKPEIKKLMDETGVTDGD